MPGLKAAVDYSFRTPSSQRVADERLLVAARIGDAVETQAALAAGANPDCTSNDFGWTPLHIAAMKGHFHIISILLDGGATVDVGDSAGHTPLHDAACCGHLDCTRLLLDAGADPNRGTDDRFPLRCATERGHYEVADLIRSRDYYNQDVQDYFFNLTRYQYRDKKNILRPDQSQKPLPRVLITNSGPLVGTWMKSRTEKQFLAFRKVPYAKAPTGHLRFKDPEPVGMWVGIQDATIPGDPCVQWNYAENGPTKGNEDCLFLSIFTPVIPKKTVVFSDNFADKWKQINLLKSKKENKGLLPKPPMLPVLVYIHGGCFEYGDGVTAGEGPEFIMDINLVFVKINYRLGALGFLSFEDEELPGNYGLKDQTMALKWIKDNIAFFGGDPNNITLIGENAGGASIHFHMLSPLSKGLFQRVIISSGSGYSPWALARNGRAREAALRTADQLGCTRATTKEMVDCLRTRDPYQIVDQRRALITDYKDPVCLYVPVIDWKAKQPFLPNHLHKLEPAKVDVMFGVTSADGLLKTSFYTKYGQFDWSLIDYYFPQYFKDVLLLQPGRVGIEEHIDEIRTFYFGYDPISDYSYSNITNLFTDGWFFVPMVQAFKNHPANVYLYYFDYLGQNSYADVFGRRRVVDGACHRDETIYLLNITDNRTFQPLSEKEKTFSNQLVQVWADFARTGNPGNGISFTLGDWRKRDYVSISPAGFVVKQDLLKEVIHFWTKLNIIS